MGRIGVKSAEEIKEIEEYISEHSAFHLEGTFTHFAQADSLDKTYYDQQLATFVDLLNSFNHVQRSSIRVIQLHPYVTLKDTLMRFDWEFQCMV